MILLEMKDFGAGCPAIFWILTWARTHSLHSPGQWNWVDDTIKANDRLQKTYLVSVIIFFLIFLISAIQFVYMYTMEDLSKKLWDANIARHPVDHYNMSTSFLLTTTLLVFLPLTEGYCCSIARMQLNWD